MNHYAPAQYGSVCMCFVRLSIATNRLLGLKLPFSRTQRRAISHWESNQSLNLFTNFAKTELFRCQNLKDNEDHLSASDVMLPFTQTP